MLRLQALWLASAFVVSGLAAAAPPDVPARIHYQGVLLDDLGQPRTGPIDLTVRIHDGLLGSAVLLYRQDFAGVPLNEGVFSIMIGPAGEATDTPTDPLTTSLETVFAGDLVAGPDRFIELTVAGDTAQTRVQILSSPLALRAQSADTAATADVATRVVSIDGLAPETLGEIFEHFDFDGGAPPNDDPREGLGDADGDGVANFLEEDNDDDGISDVAELAQGTDINQVTPVVSDVIPGVTDFAFPATVTVIGSNFEPGLAVQFGTQSPAPSNVSPTSFDVTVGPQAPDFFPDVTVTLPNGESDTASGLFQFASFTPTIGNLFPTEAFDNETVEVTVFGSNFVPGITVQFGNESPTPTNITPNAFDVTVGPQPFGLVSITVTRPNGTFAVGTDVFEFLESPPATAFAHTSAGPVSSFSVASDGASVVGDEIDLDANQTWTVDGLIDPVSSIGGTFDFAFDPTDTLGALIAIRTGGACDLQVRRDDNGNGRVTTADSTVIETFGGLGCEIIAPSLDFRANGGAVAAYSRDGSGLQLAVDYNADEDWDDSSERITLDIGTSPQIVEAVVDPSDQVAVAWTGSDGSPVARLFHDRNGDRDFSDANEEVTLPPTGSLTCLGLAFDDGGRPGIVYRESGSSQVVLLHDRNGDGDFGDVDEEQAFTVANGSQCAITGIPTGFALAFDQSSQYRQLADLDGDDQFVGTGEDVILGPAQTLGEIRMGTDGTGGIFLATPEFVYVPSP